MTVRHRSSATTSMFTLDEVVTPTTTDTAREEENPPLSGEPEGTVTSQDSIQFHEEDEDNENLTIIGLDDDTEQGDSDQQALAWMHQNRPEIEERRRNILLRELQRVQRASFIHFALICLIPTTLLFIVVVTVLGEDEDCNSVATTCVKEAGTFMNAFTTRCICDAIDVNEG